MQLLQPADQHLSVLHCSADMRFKHYSKHGWQVSWYCRYHFAEFSYLRVADKKHDVPEHIEKTVLFLVDPSAVAKPEPNVQDLGGAAAAKQEAEAQATAAMKAAWRVAKQAKEVRITWGYS